MMAPVSMLGRTNYPGAKDKTIRHEILKYEIT